MRGIKNEVVDRASRYVQRHARYHPDAPKYRYAVRWPEGATEAFLSDDTWDLVSQVARAMNKKQRKPRQSTRKREVN